VKYITVSEKAKELAISAQLVRRWAKLARWENCQKFGSSWLIPAGAIPKKKFSRKAGKREGGK